MVKSITLTSRPLAFSYRKCNEVHRKNTMSTNNRQSCEIAGSAAFCKATIDFEGLLDSWKDLARNRMH